jgi:hypothetical protein
LSAAQQILTAASSIIDDVPTSSEDRLNLKRRRELTPYKRNVSPRPETPVTVLQPINVLQHVLHDENREYIKKTTHMAQECHAEEEVLQFNQQTGCWSSKDNRAGQILAESSIKTEPVTTITIPIKDIKGQKS